MSPTSKRLKISCIASLFVGLAILICGIIFVVRDTADPNAYLTSAAGLSTAALGVVAARLANVPSNARRIMALAAMATVVALTACIASVAMPTQLVPTSTVVDAVATICPATVLMLARAVKRIEDIV